MRRVVPEWRVEVLGLCASGREAIEHGHGVIYCASTDLFTTYGDEMHRDEQTSVRGRCLCGACVFELRGPPNWVAHCHCHSCRKATASPFTTWIGQENGTWAFLGDDPVSYESSPGHTRGFCGTCGSPLFFRSDRYPNEMHFYAALLDDPGRVAPEGHDHAEEKLSWIHISDGLPFR